VFLPSLPLIRVCAGLNHVLLEATGDGHCALPVELPKDEAGKVVGAGLRSLRFGEIEWDKILTQENSPDAETTAFVEMICATPWLYAQEAALVGDTPGGENHFVKGAERL